MNNLSPITKFIESFLRKQGKPVSMKKIVEAASKKFPDDTHAKFWNAVHNNCVTQSPRFKAVTKGGKNLFTITEK